MEQYWYLLAEALIETIDEKKKKDLIKVLEALLYCTGSSDVNSEKFDHIMTKINFMQAEKEITDKYQRKFNYDD
jgi:hypothetical protein